MEDYSTGLSVHNRIDRRRRGGRYPNELENSFYTALYAGGSLVVSISLEPLVQLGSMSIAPT